MLSKQDAVVATLSSLLAEKNQTYRLRERSGKKTVQIGAGMFQSLFKGRGLEFAEVREYKPGDDVRLIDWRLSAKYHKTFTKIFHEEREHSVCFLLDESRSMHFATRQAFKSVLAAHVTAFLSWAFQEENNRIGGVLLTEKNLTSFKPSRYRRNLMHFLEAVCLGTQPTLQSQTSPKAPSFAQACAMLQRMCKHGHIVFVISDFSQLDEASVASLGTLAKTNELICIHVFDVLEKKAPPPAMYRVTNGKDVLVLNTQSTKAQEAYTNFFEKSRRLIKNLQNKYRMLYIPISTDQDAISTVIQALQEKQSHER